MGENKTTFKEILEKQGTLVYTFKGVSMMPLLRQGKDIIIIKKQEPPYHKNDTVLFLRPNGQYVLHRITKVFDKKYFIMGDNCLKGEMVNEDQILGVLTDIHRGKKDIQVTDPKYKLYERVVPLWRMKVRARNILGRVKRKMNSFLK